MDWLARLKALYWKLPSRCARPASVRRNVVKTLWQSLGMGIVFLVVGPLLLWQIESWILRHQWPLNWPLSRFAPLPIWAGALFVLGALLAWWSGWTLARWGEGTPLPIDATNRLVVRGPYRWVRNPMAIGSLTQGAAIGLGVGSPLLVLYSVAGGLLWNLAVRPWEEADLHARFGPEFEHYRQHVRCWLPRLSPY